MFEHDKPGRSLDRPGLSFLVIDLTELVDWALISDIKFR